MMVQGRVVDRRQHPRVPYGAYVKQIDPTGKTRFCLARNLSLGGILLLADPPPPLGERLRLLLVIENESQSMFIEAEVVRHGASNGDTCFGARFVNVDQEQRAFVETLVGGLAAPHAD
jgi:hypothetical protein